MKQAPKRCAFLGVQTTENLTIVSVCDFRELRENVAGLPGHGKQPHTTIPRLSLTCDPLLPLKFVEYFRDSSTCKAQGIGEFRSGCSMSRVERTQYNPLGDGRVSRIQSPSECARVVTGDASQPVADVALKA